MNPTVPTIDGQTRFALAYLRRHLTDSTDFSIDAIGAIIEHVRAEGCIDGARFVRPDEIDPLTEVFINAFPEVAWDDPAWLIDSDLWTASDSLDWDFPDPAPDANWSRMKPIAGDQDIPPPYEPTPEDWESYRQWCATVYAMDEINDCRDGEESA
jgi:hypothetical protein